MVSCCSARHSRLPHRAVVGLYATREGTTREPLTLVLVAQPVEPLLHLFHLALEVVDLDATVGARPGLGSLGGLTLAAREGAEHREGALEHFHVPPHLVLERAERSAAEGLRQLLAEFFLLARERVDRNLEIARHQ